MPKTKDENRPRIWAEGSQNPPFDIRAFALASVSFARDSLSGLLSRCSASARGFGAEVATGRWRVPENRLGRSGRFLPSVGRTAAAIGGGAEVLARTARVVAHGTGEPPAPMPAVATTRPTPRPAQARPAPGEDIDLAAIRALMRDQPPAAMAQIEAPQPEDAPPSPAGSGRIGEGLATGAAWLLGHALLVLSVPVGAVLAALAHLKGEDLRKMTGD